MGWWRTDGDDLMGDGPLDLIGGTLDHLATEREAAGQPPPKPRTFLSAAIRALDAAGWPVDELHARLEPAGEHIAATGGDADEPTLVRALTEVLFAVAAEYDEVVGREPRLSELLLALRLGLVPEPERHLRVEAGTRLAALTAETPSSRDT